MSRQILQEGCFSEKLFTAYNHIVVYTGHQGGVEVNLQHKEACE